MMKNDYLATFIERLNTYQIIRSNPFLTLYEEWFIEVRKGLENEIYENLLLTSTNKIEYLEYIKKRVTEEIEYKKGSLFLNKWIDEYSLSDLIFPFTKNNEIEQILGTSVNQSSLEYKEKKLCTNMQMDFYCHVAMGEKYNMIEFINKLISQENKSIGKSYKNEIWFKLGLLFASGEMEKYYSVNDIGTTVLKGTNTPAGVAKKLGHDNYNKFILASINNYDQKKANGNKNIFNSRDKMLKVISHCEKNNIPVTSYFKGRLPSE